MRRENKISSLEQLKELKDSVVPRKRTADPDQRIDSTKSYYERVRELHNSRGEESLFIFSKMKKDEKRNFIASFKDFARVNLLKEIAKDFDMLYDLIKRSDLLSQLKIYYEVKSFYDNKNDLLRIFNSIVAYKDLNERKTIKYFFEKENYTLSPEEFIRLSDNSVFLELKEESLEDNFYSDVIKKSRDNAFMRLKIENYWEPLNEAVEEGSWVCTIGKMTKIIKDLERENYPKDSLFGLIKRGMSSDKTYSLYGFYLDRICHISGHNNKQINYIINEKPREIVEILLRDKNNSKRIPEQLKKYLKITDYSREMLINFLTTYTKTKFTVEELLIRIAKLKKSSWYWKRSIYPNIKLTSMRGVEALYKVKDEFTYRKPTLDFPIEDLELEEKKKIISVSPWLISEFQRPEIELMKIAININLGTLKVIKNPTEEIVRHAAKKSPTALKHIKQDPRLAIAAVNANKDAVKYVDDKLFEGLE